jgi:hypothetical protein
MKKTLFLIAISMTTLFSSQLSAFDWGCCESIDWRCGWDAEFRVAAFNPSSKQYRRSFGNWTAEYQFEVAKRFNECSDFYGFISTGYQSKRAHHEGCGGFDFDSHRNHSRNWTVPLNFGVKYMSCLTSCLDYYLGFGASCRFLHLKDRSHHFDDFDGRGHSHNSTKTAWGFIAKSGLRYKVWECTYLDLFVDYTYNHLSTHHHGHGRHLSSNVGGVLLGGGIGMTF